MEKETKFNFNIPLEVFEKGDEWRIGGIASTENKDFQGEIVKIDGLDISTLATSGFFNEDHKKGFQHVLGKIDKAEKREDATVGKHLYIEGKLFKTMPGAQAAYNLMKELKDGEKKMQLSIEGKILKREGKDKKIVAKAKVENVALTLNPINDTTFATFVKSFEGAELGEVEENTVDVKLSKSTYDKLLDMIDNKMTFKERIHDLVKGMTPEARDGVFKVLIKAKEELEAKKCNKALGATDSYATQLPQERTGGDVMTQESLDKKKKKIKSVVESAAKSFPDVGLDKIFNTVIQKLK